MARIKIKDLPKDRRISRVEMKKISGTGYGCNGLGVNGMGVNGFIANGLSGNGFSINSLSTNLFAYYKAPWP